MVELVMFLFFFLQGGIVQTVIWLVLGMWRGGGNTIFDALGSDLRVSIPSGYYIVAFSNKCGIMVCQNALVHLTRLCSRKNELLSHAIKGGPVALHKRTAILAPTPCSAPPPRLLQATAAPQSLSI